MLRCFSWPGCARRVVMLVILGVVLSGAVGEPAAAMPARVAGTTGLGQATDRGVTSNTIAVGVIDAYGMPLANDLVTPEVNGLQAAFDAINDSGGVYGRRFVLYACDDGVGDQASSDACITKLVRQDHIFALVGGVDWGSPGNFPSLREYQLPYVGSWGYANTEWTDQRYFPAVTSTAHQAAAAAWWLLNTQHPKTYGLLCLNAPTDQGACQKAQAVLAPSGAKMVHKVNVDLSAADLSSQVLAMKLANPGAIIAEVSSPELITEFMTDASEQGYYPPLGIVSSDMATEALGGLFGQWPVNRFWTTTPYELWGNTFMSTMANYAPDNHGLESGYVQAGYVAANMLKQAAKRVGPDLTRQKLVRVLTRRTWSADPDLGQSLVYTSAGLPQRGGEANTLNCRVYMYEYTSSDTTSSSGSPVGFAPAQSDFVARDPLSSDCTYP